MSLNSARNWTRTKTWNFTNSTTYETKEKTMSEACIIVGVPLDEVVKTKVKPENVKRFNERTGEAYIKSIKELTIEIAGNVVYKDEYDLFMDKHDNMDRWIDDKIQEIIGSRGIVNAFREYNLLGVDSTCLEEGERLQHGKIVNQLDIKQVLATVNAVERTLESVMPDDFSREVGVYLCGDHYDPITPDEGDGDPTDYDEASL